MIHNDFKESTKGEISIGNQDNVIINNKITPSPKPPKNKHKTVIKKAGYYYILLYSQLFSHSIHRSYQILGK